MEMGWTRGQATRRQMDIPSYHVGPPHRKEASGQTSAQMGRLLQRTSRSTMFQRGKRQKKVETTRETFVHRQEPVPTSYQLLVYADDVNVLGENPQTIREYMEILLEASKEIGLEVNPEKTKYMLVSRCETWTLTLREEQRLRVFENKVLRKTSGAKRDEVTGEWRKLNNAELHALYSSPDIIRNIKSRHLRWTGHVERMGESINAYRVLVGRPERKRPLRRPRRRWEDNIKMDLREVEYDNKEWINLAQDRDRWPKQGDNCGVTSRIPSFYSRVNDLVGEGICIQCLCCDCADEKKRKKGDNVKYKDDEAKQNDDDDDYDRKDNDYDVKDGHKMKKKMILVVTKKAKYNVTLLEPSGINRSDGKRPDGLTLISWSKGKSLRPIWDFTCVDTLALSHLKSSFNCDGSAAESAYHAKRRQAIGQSKIHVQRPSQAKPSQAKPSQAKPSQAKPSQAKPSQAKSSQVKSIQVKRTQAKSKCKDPFRDTFGNIQVTAVANELHSKALVFLNRRMRIARCTNPDYTRDSEWFLWLLGASLVNDSVSTARLFSVEGLYDGYIMLDEMRTRIRCRLPSIRLIVGEYLGKNQPGNQPKRESDPRQNPASDQRRRIFCGPLEKELRKRLVKCFVWSVALYGEGTWTLRRNKEKRIEAFEMWMWRRTVRVKWTDRIRNKIVFEKVSEERMMLKLIRKRKRNWLGLWLKRIIDDIRICESYAETKRKVENRKDWRLLGLQ
ncbi:hypothetical protein ANN_24378 [Periplaneta americana]|uniref:Reverse transcriptase domain-containing protein n=1 Tax=Periplaneta americana TaxID=6978 RepID=A0ABQ8S393_PERAM|nr:hypothetical protein ANN_24378 [Periplaneta americana]